MILLSLSAASGQDFEVASIRLVSDGPIQVPAGQIGIGPATRPVKLIGDRIDALAPVKDLICVAYEIPSQQIAGPEWLKNRLYQVKALVPSGTTKDLVPAMMRRLLAGRLGLRVHWEDRIQTVQALLAEAKGHKLIEVQDPDNAPKRDIKIGSTTMKSSVYLGPGQFFAAAMDLDTLAARLCQEFEEPVVNKTGLDKRYRIDAKWTPNPRPGIVPGSTGSDSEFPRALLKQLGLRLEKQRLPQRMLIVEHANAMPTGN